MPFGSDQYHCNTTTSDAIATPTPSSPFESGTQLEYNALEDLFDFDGFCAVDYTLLSKSGTETSPIDMHFNQFPEMLPELVSLPIYTEWPTTTRSQRTPQHPAVASNLPTLLPYSHHTIARSGPLGASAFQDTSASRDMSAAVLPILASAPALATSIQRTPSCALGTSSSPSKPRSSLLGRGSSGNRKRVVCTQDDCSASFGRPIDFRRHLRTAHQQLGSGTEYHCLVSSCRYSYPRSDKVRDHMKKVHGLRLSQV